MLLPASLMLAVLAFFASPARAVPDSCGDMILPSLGDGLNVTGTIPAGPRLLATSDATGYTYLVNNGTNALELWVQSYPGVGLTDYYSRKVEILLSSRTPTTFAAATGLDASCLKTFAPFAFSAGHSGTTISAASTDLTEIASGAAANCYFNHLWSMDYDVFRASPASSCGFVLSDDTSVANSTFKALTGRVHVRWTDYYNATVTGSSNPRDPMDTWYDVTLRIQSEANYTGAPTSGAEDPYNADFKVIGITYTKANTGLVTAAIAYSLSTKFPYYPSFKVGGTADDVLVRTGGTGALSNYAGNFLLDPAQYGDTTPVFTNVPGTDPTTCTFGQNCVMTGTLQYAWTPNAAESASCKISSNDPYQFDFKLQCKADYNGTINSVCGADMRGALDLSAFGSFSLQGNLDFCKAASTDFPITWSSAFDIDDATRTIGQTIQAGGSFTSAKAIAAVGIKSYTVVRGGTGDSATWSLWDGVTGVTSTGANNDAYTTIGTNVNFQRSIVATGDKKGYTVTTWFTPNIKLNSGLAAGTLTADRLAYMIVLPDDKSKTLTFTMTIALRLYSDTTQTFRRRRLMYRDAVIPAVAPEPVNDISQTTSPVSLKVPDTVQINKDGSVTVVTAPATLSVGAIAGIAAIGAAVAAAAIGLTVLVVRKHKRDAAAKADAEAALVQQGSTDFMVKQGQKEVPYYPINTRVVA